MYAICKNNIVANVVTAESAYAESQGWVLLPEGFGVGDSYINGQFVKAPVPAPTPEEIQRQNKQQATSQLQATDWVELFDVSNPTLTPHLVNKPAFTAYRSELRAIAVNPPAIVVNPWPVKPDEQWSS